MVERKSNIYLVAGGSFRQRQEAVKEIKKKISEKEKPPVELFTLYAASLSLESFQDSVSTLSFQKKKIILVKNFTVLPKPVKKLFTACLSKVLDFNYFIFESETPYFSLAKDKRISSDNFFQMIFGKSVKYQGRRQKRELTIEDFRNLLYREDFKGCLFAIEGLLNSKSKEKAFAVQAVGILAGKFAYFRDHKKKKEALDCLWEADRRLKETNLDPRLILERLLVGLSQKKFFKEFIFPD